MEIPGFRVWNRVVITSCAVVFIFHCSNNYLKWIKDIPKKLARVNTKSDGGFKLNVLIFHKDVFGLGTLWLHIYY